MAKVVLVVGKEGSKKYDLKKNRKEFNWLKMILIFWEPI